MENLGTPSAQAGAQDTISQPKTERPDGILYATGDDEEIDAAFEAFHRLQSGVDDPTENPLPEFESLKYDLMVAIKPYDLDVVMAEMSDKEQIWNRAERYNQAHTYLTAGKYHECLTICEDGLNCYFLHPGFKARNRKHDLDISDSVHFWKLRIMRMMILPFVASPGNIFPSGDTAIEDRVLAVLYSKEIPQAFQKPPIFHSIVCAERVRFSRRCRQQVIGVAEEKDEIRKGRASESGHEIRESEKTGFLPVNDELLEIRYETLIAENYYAPW
ncbi:MAG: hypothetical protein Q9213_000701 [Squamulea squamosa]